MIFLHKLSYFSTRYGDSKIVHELLDQGASLGAKDQYDSMPIHDIKPELLEEHLDNCVKFDGKSNFKVENEYFKIALSFRTLIPPYARPRKESEKDVEAAGITSLVTKDLVKETEVGILITIKMMIDLIFFRLYHLWLTPRSTSIYLVILLL